MWFKKRYMIQQVRSVFFLKKFWVFFVNYEITQVSNSPKLEIIWRHFYKGTPKLISQKLPKWPFYKSSGWLLLDIPFSLEKYHQYFIIDQLEPICSQLSTHKFFFPAHIFYLQVIKKTNILWVMKAFNDFSWEFQIMISLSAITGYFPIKSNTQEL